MGILLKQKRKMTYNETNGIQRTANEHIAKIAALPRVDRKSVFLRSLLALIKCWEAATSAICHHVSRHLRTAQR